MFPGLSPATPNCARVASHTQFAGGCSLQSLAYFLGFPPLDSVLNPIYIPSNVSKLIAHVSWDYNAFWLNSSQTYFIPIYPGSFYLRPVCHDN